jgi:hypothetical protein
MARSKSLFLIVCAALFAASACNLPTAIGGQGTTSIPVTVREGAAAEYRTGPGPTFDLVGVLNPGQEVEAFGLSPDGDYLLIRDPANSGVPCWLKRDSTTLTGIPVGLPISTLPPTPTMVPGQEVAGICPTPIGGGPTPVSCPTLVDGNPSGGCPTPVGGGPTPVGCPTLVPGLTLPPRGCPTPIGGGPTPVGCPTLVVGPTLPPRGCPTPVGGGPTPVSCPTRVVGPTSVGGCPTPVGGGPTPVSCRPRVTLPPPRGGPTLPPTLVK